MSDAQRLICTSETRGVPLEVFGHAMLASAFAFAPSCREVLCVHLGEISDGAPVPVRLHSGCVTGDVFGSPRCDCGWQLRHAVELLVRTGRGVVVYLPSQDGRGAGLPTLLRSFVLMDEGHSSAQAFTTLGQPFDIRSYAPGVAALRLLGVRSVHLITNNPAKLRAMAAAGFDLRERIPSVMETDDPDMRRYVQSKTELGHLIEAS